MAKSFRVAQLDDEERARLRLRHPFLEGPLVVLSVPDERTADDLRTIVERADHDSLLATEERRGALLDSLMRGVVPRLASGVTQVELEAEARTDVLRRWEFLGSHDVARRAGSASTNLGATASNWRRRDRIFGVEHEGRMLFPAFQFDERGRPRAWVQQVLAEFRRRGEDDWSVALWFESPNGWLDDAAPIDRLDDPEAIAAAAEREFAEVEF